MWGVMVTEIKAALSKPGNAMKFAGSFVEAYEPSRRLKRSSDFSPAC
jgi:hypothetical protein